MKRSAPMKRTGFARKPSPSPFALADRKTSEQRTKQRAKLKSRPKKPTVAEGSKYLAACRGERCFLAVICGGEASPDIVVPCHSNQSKHGKGGALKAKHIFTGPGCHWCHQWLDQGKAPREEKFSAFDRALEAWEPVRAAKMEAV